MPRQLGAFEQLMDLEEAVFVLVLVQNSLQIQGLQRRALCESALQDNSGGDPEGTVTSIRLPDHAMPWEKSAREGSTLAIQIDSDASDSDCEM